MSLSPQQIAQYAAQAGFTGVNLVTAVAVALAESGGDPGAVNRGTPGHPENSQGLWQINLDAHPQYNGTNIMDPSSNAAAAFAVSSGGNNFGPWSTFTNGSYKNYISQALAAIGSLGLGQLFGSASTATTSTLGPGGGPLVSLPTITIPGAKDVTSAITNAGQGAIQAIQQFTAPITSAIGNLTSILTSLDNPSFVTGAGMILIGVLLSIIGVILFGLSLVPSSVQSNALKAATAL